MDDRVDENLLAESHKQFRDTVFSRLWFDYVIPELLRRGITEDPAKYVSRAEIIRRIGESELEIRLNNETRADVLFKYAGPSSPWDGIVKPELVGEVTAVAISCEDVRTAHDFLIRGRDGWWVTFDYRYYRDKILSCVSTAREFAYAARASLEANSLRAFTETIYTAAELLAWAQLLIVPHPSIVNSRTHKHIVSSFNQWVKLGNAELAFADLLNRYWQLRNGARYRESYRLDEVQARSDLAFVDTVVSQLSQWQPTRPMGPLALPNRPPQSS